MVLRQKLGQLMIVGISGTSLTEVEKKFLVENNIGGVVLFARNVESPEQIHKLCSEIQKLRFATPNKTPFYIGIDMEGGRVARLKEPFTQWPSQRKLGDLNSPAMCFHFTYSMGKELKAVGINLDFAPCVDVLTNPKNTVIGDRALSTDAETVAKLTSALVRGFVKAEVMSCVKHFPGHGNTLVDSHDALPVEESTIESLLKTELVPFKRAFKARVDMVMTSHILFKNIDEKWPVTLSDTFIKKLLRDECRYKGIVVTDDLGMKALSVNYKKEEIPIRAFEAGVDLLLYCNEPDAPAQALEVLLKAIEKGKLSQTHIDLSYNKVIKHKTESLTQADPEPWSEVEAYIGHPDHKKIAEAIAEGKVPDGLTGFGEAASA
jgi:beta-N-acetylhexosaminidase